MTDAKTLRADFLNEVRPFVLDYVAVARGEGVMPHLDKVARAEVWDAAKRLMVQAGDAQKLDAKNTSDVLNLLSAGTVTVAEATELMKLLRVQSDIDELPKLVAALEKANA